MLIQKTAFSFAAFLREVFKAYWILVRIMIPALIIVRALEQVGATQWLAWLLSPLMSAIGLPSEWGLIWAAGILTNIYTAMVVFYEVAGGDSFSVAQISILGLLLLLSHALPVEGAVARVLNVPWRLTFALRVGGGYLLALICFQLFAFFGYGSEAAFSVWQPEPRELGWLAWLLEQLHLLGMIFVILASLMAFLKFLRVIGVERVLQVLLLPLMKVMTVRREAANVTIVGLLLGLSFGAGLLIDAARSKVISKRDMQIVACFLSLCHSLVEDTLLIMLLGADLSTILVGRVLFSCLVIALIARFLYPKGDTGT